MSKRTFTEAEIRDLTDDAEEVDRQAWRHGSRVQFVFNANVDDESKAPEMYRTPLIEVHSEEGMQLYGDVECERVEEVEQIVAVWMSEAERAKYDAQVSEAMRAAPAVKS